MSKGNFRSEKRVGKIKAYKADERQKTEDRKKRHLDPEKRSEDRKGAAENKTGYSTYVKKRTNTTFSKAKEDSIPDDKMRINKF